MAAIYKIHPGIGIARLGDSEREFCISPEEPAAMPLACDNQGNVLYGPDGTTQTRVTALKDAEGRIKRQAARFQVYVYDEKSPQGRPLKLGDPIEGGGNDGVLVDIQWRVYLANKKAVWYEFRQLQGEHGYSSSHPRRNADITDSNARQRLIIDPGPRSVDLTSQRRASFDREGGNLYAPTFPPPLRPHDIHTLGEILTDDAARLLVLGGHGHSGSWRFAEFGQPRIDTYANNDGWFDDTSDGPVMARLVMYSKRVGALRFIDVEAPAWVIVGYPSYLPQILDLVTLDDLMVDLGVRQFAARPDIYGLAGTFDQPQRVDPRDADALVWWRAGDLRWNPDYKPWFYRDIWPILFRPAEFGYVTDILGQSNFPHSQASRGTFDPEKLSLPPVVDERALELAEQRCVQQHHRGELFLEALSPRLAALDRELRAKGLNTSLGDQMSGALADVARRFAEAVLGEAPSDFAGYREAWRAASGDAERWEHASDELDAAVHAIIDPALARLPPAVAERLTAIIHAEQTRLLAGRLLDERREAAVVACTWDPFRPMRQYLMDLLRQPGEENRFKVAGKPDSRVHNLPLMPLLCGDNPLDNTLPSKFLRLTDLQYYMLRQWARGIFVNEVLEGWVPRPDPQQPYASWTNRTGADLDRGVLSNLMGGSFCPGAEVSWIIRNPSIYLEPFRVKADPRFSAFRLTAAQSNAWRGAVPPSVYSSYTGDDLSQDNDFDTGLQPGDLTKYSAVPWQSDFNECTTQPIDVTYQEWNDLYPDSDGDSALERQQRSWVTLWWPGHRPLQGYVITGMGSDGTPQYVWTDWAPGLPQTLAGDLKMVEEWSRLGFYVRNPFVKTPDPLQAPGDMKYIITERTPPRSRKEPS